MWELGHSALAQSKIHIGLKSICALVFAFLNALRLWETVAITMETSLDWPCFPVSRGGGAL